MCRWTITFNANQIWGLHVGLQNAIPFGVVFFFQVSVYWANLVTAAVVFLALHMCSFQ